MANATKQYADLVGALEPGTTIYTVLRHVSRSGMQRVISAHYVQDGEVRWIDLGATLGYRMHKTERGYVVNGAGMDMGFHVVYSLSMALHGDGYALNHRWL